MELLFVYLIVYLFTVIEPPTGLQPPLSAVNRNPSQLSFDEFSRWIYPLKEKSENEKAIDNPPVVYLKPGV